MLLLVHVDPHAVTGRHRALVEQASDGIMVFDERGRILTGNGAALELFGLSRPGLIGKRVVELFHPDDVEHAPATEADRDRYRQLLEQTVLADGVKVVIADKECGITFHRRARSIDVYRIGDRGPFFRVETRRRRR